MSKKKWFGLAAVGAAVAGAGAFVIAKARKAPEAAQESFEAVKTTVKESPQKAAAVIDSAKERMRREPSDEAADAAADEAEDASGSEDAGSSEDE